MALSNETKRSVLKQTIGETIGSETPNKLNHSNVPISDISDCDSKIQSRSSNRKVINVLVGDKVFRIKRETLTRHSTYFEEALTKDSSFIDLKTVSDDHEAIITVLKWMKGKGLSLTRLNVTSVLNVALKLNIIAVLHMGIDFLMGELHLQNKNVNRLSFQEIVNGPYFRHFSIEQIYRLLSDDELDIQKETEVFNAAIKWLSHDWNRRQRLAIKLIGCVRFGLMSDRDILDISNSPNTAAIMEIPECQSFALSGLLYRIAQSSGSAEECLKYAPRPRFCLQEQPHLRAGREGDEDVLSKSTSFLQELDKQSIASASLLQELDNQSIASASLVQELDKQSIASASRNEKEHVKDKIEDPFQFKEVTNRDIDDLKDVQSPPNAENHQSNSHKIPNLICLVNDPCLLVIGGINPDNLDFPQNGSILWRFSPRENRWDRVLELPEPRINSGAVYLAGIVYVIGGCFPPTQAHKRKLEPLPTVLTLEVDNGEWSFAEPLLYPRMNHAVCECRGLIYSVGGTGVDGKLLDSVECFDPSNGQWFSINSLSTARMGMSIGVFDGHVWVCGGIGNSKKNTKFPKVLDSVECLCLNNNSWHDCPPLRHARCFAAMTNFFGYLCLIGGAVLDPDCQLNSSSDVDFMNKTTKIWKKITELDRPRHFAVAVTLGQHLHVIGGASTIGYSAMSSIECYSLRNRSWVEGVTSLPVPLVGISGVLLPPRPISED